MSRGCGLTVGRGCGLAVGSGLGVWSNFAVVIVLLLFSYTLAHLLYSFHTHTLTPSHRSFPHTLTPSHFHSITPSQKNTYSTNHTLTPSLSPPHPLTPSLSPPHPLTPSPPHPLTPSHLHTFTWNLAVASSPEKTESVHETPSL